MNVVYFFLKIIVAYGLRFYFRSIRLINAPRQFLGRTIYVSNHPAAFMDPIMIGALQTPIVFFMTRSDIFNKYTRPFLRACHMLPIYRQHDGEDTKKKNDVVFNKCTRILSSGRNLLLFGEGFTDDTFIRRLKPLKKGAVKIGFATLEKQNWKKKIYMAGLGCNYTAPNKVGSDVLIAVSKKICLNDYKEMYLEAPNKAITQVTRLVEEMMQEQITHVQNTKNADFHEQIMSLTRKGMNPENFDKKYSLEQRWNYSKGLANWMNVQDSESKDFSELKEQTNNYFNLLKRFKIQDSNVFWKANSSSGSRLKEILSMFILAPFALLGLIHLGLPYYITKNFVEKSFKRKVFWGSTKLIVGGLLSAILNVGYLFLFYHFVYPSWWLAFLYFFTIIAFGLAAYKWMEYLKLFKTKGAINKTNLSKIIEKRESLLSKIKAFIPESL